VELDVRQPESITAAFDAAEQALGPVTILINNAAANFPVAAQKLSPNGWRAVEQIVLDGTFFCSQELHRRVTSRGGDASGSIVNIVSTAASSGGPGMVHSASAKAGVVSMTKTLAVEWAPTIRVNAIAPGLFPHDDLPEAIQAVRNHDLDDSRQPAGRVGSPHELGWAATYLCSPYAAFITGHVLVVDGGNWLRRDFAMPPFTPIKDQLGGD
jgi:NAD(P)-dependent dehydrogenase (short-subunit alcohol dehydrogenase family)